MPYLILRDLCDGTKRSKRTGHDVHQKKIKSVRGIVTDKQQRVRARFNEIVRKLRDEALRNGHSVQQALSGKWDVRFRDECRTLALFELYETGDEQLWAENFDEVDGVVTASLRAIRDDKEVVRFEKKFSIQA